MTNGSWTDDLAIVRQRYELRRECDALAASVWFQLKRKYQAPRFFTDSDAKVLDRVATEIWLRRLKIYFLGGPPVYGKANFNPDQPRVPAGNPDGGQWTSTWGVTRGGSIDLSAAKARGHHIVPRKIYRDLPLSAETKKVFDRAVTGPLRAEVHGWSKAHKLYNDAVGENLKRFLNQKGIQPENMTASQAKEFVDQIYRSHDVRIRSYNMRIFMKEFQFYLRRVPRRFE